jgi:hypothetical protein
MAAGPVAEPARERSSAPAVEQVAAVEPMVVELSALAIESAAAAPAAEPAAAVRLVSETLPVLALELATVEESAAGVLAGEPAAVEPIAATAAVSAAWPTAAKGGRPVLADGPAAGPRECWVINPEITPKVIVKRVPSGSAASWEIRAGELCQGWDRPQRQGGRQRRLGLRPWRRRQGWQRRRQRRQEKEKQELVWQEGHKRGKSPHQSRSKTCNGVNPLV